MTAIPVSGSSPMPPPWVFIIAHDQAIRTNLALLARSTGHRSRVFVTPGDFLEQPEDQAPGCLVYQVDSPQMSGIDIPWARLSGRPAMPVILVATQGDVRMAVSAMKAGALNFFTSPWQDSDLLAALEEGIATAQTRLRQLAPRENWHNSLSTLSPREREVLGHIVAGRLNKQIAADLGVSEQTIKVHRMRIKGKLQVRSTTELVQRMEKWGHAQSS